jgi:putative transcriptional regulator
MELRNRLKETRGRCTLTQEVLAKAVGVTRQTIIAIEKGGYAPSVTLALRLSQALDVPLEEIFWLRESQGEIP